MSSRVGGEGTAGQGPGDFKTVHVHAGVCKGPQTRRSLTKRLFQRQPGSVTSFPELEPRLPYFPSPGVCPTVRAGSPQRAVLSPLKMRLCDPKSWQSSAEALQALAHRCIPSARSNSVTLEAREKVVCSDRTTALDSLRAKRVGFQSLQSDRWAPRLLKNEPLSPLLSEGMNGTA